MADFLTVHGVKVETLADTWEESTERSGDVDDAAASGARIETHVRDQRVWRGRAGPFMVAATYEKLRRFVEGAGHSWAFLVDGYSGKGRGDSANGTFTINPASGGKHAGSGKVNVGSGSQWRPDLYRAMGERGGTWDPEDAGFTVIFWTDRTNAADGIADGQHHFIVTGHAASARGVTANPPDWTQYLDGAVGSHKAGNILGVDTAGRIGLHGYTLNNVAAAKDYSNVVILPFEVEASWVAGIYAFHSANIWGALSRVKIAGDIVSDAAPVIVRARFGKTPIRNVIKNGVALKNTRHAPELTLHEDR